MEDPGEEQKTEQEAPAKVGRAQKLRNFVAGVGHFFGKWLPRLGLFVFVLMLPALVIGYPGYLGATRLIDFVTSEQVTAKLSGIDLNTVEPSGDQEGFFKEKRHIEVSFHFKMADGKRMVAKASHSWPSPGLKRKLEEQYEIGEEYTLYMTKLNGIMTEEDAAIKMFYWMTALMALVMLGSAMMLMIWVRLLSKVPDVLPTISSATVRSLIYGQLIALFIAMAMSVIISQRPTVIPPVLYFGAYAGVALLMVLALRLLAFGVVSAPPEKAEADENEGDAKAPRAVAR